MKENVKGIALPDVEVRKFQSWNPGERMSYNTTVTMTKLQVHTLGNLTNMTPSEKKEN